MAMAGRGQRILVLLILFSLPEFTKQFEVKENELEDLRPNIAALYRLRGLSDHMSHDITNPLESRIDMKLDLLGLLQELQNTNNFTDFFIKKKQDFCILLAHVHKQKTDDWLLAASEISHSYSRKLLVMIDEENSTSNRVRQEYSMDPHYSVIVFTQCLFNQSCLPDVDSYTVVKIFGSVSEDGQTVSGLCGSSLANTILKTSMESASVFSLDGNTTREFQHDFIRVFILQGLMPVLETSQDNQDIYQVMDQHNFISKYQIPKRPVDRSTQYDHQQILMLQDDQVVRNAATFLYEKHPLVSSVYVLDEKLKPKLIAGKDVLLSEDSRLVLVGHGAQDGSGEMRLAKYTSKAVAEIIQSTSRVSNKIKTVSVVACDVGSDKSFIENLGKEIHGAGIETELHLRNSVLQVQHTGEKITQEISPDGNHWKHKDDSKKVVATIDRNGDIVIREEPGSRGWEVFTDERNCLVGESTKRPKNNQPQDNKSKWPVEPMRFIDPEIYKKCDQNKVDQIKHSSEELERLSWAIFQPKREGLQKVNVDNLQNEQYLIVEREGEGIKVINEQKRVKEILLNCCEIGKDQQKSGAVIREIIRRYAKSEDIPLYLMIDDWIFSVYPENLYVHPAGKKINNNDNIEDLTMHMTSQNKKGSETYKNIRGNIENPSGYAQYVRNVFHGKPRNSENSITKFWYAWYFAASVISESARNVRTFPLILMALEMAVNGNEKAVNFLYDEHSMARGGSWPGYPKKGFFGTAPTKDEINQMSKKQIKSVLKVFELESDMFKRWEETLVEKTTVNKMSELLLEYKIFQNYEEKLVERNYEHFKRKVDSSSILSPTGDEGRPTTSGVLGGYEDGYVKTTDLSSAAALENTFKHESYFLGTSASLAEEIYTQLKLKHGEALEKLRLQEGSARIEEGHFVCQVVSEGVMPVEFRAALSQESLRYYEKMVNNIETVVHDMEMMHSSAPSHLNKFVEHSGTAVGTLGLMLGMRGAVQAFEHGDIKDGVMGSLQTSHGVLPMATSAVSKQVLTSETKIAKSAARIIRSPAMRSAMIVMPVVGIGFGIYNIEQDLERHDTLGYIDAGLDSLMTSLDIVGLTVPEAEPFLAPINLALSILRMTFDDIYTGVQNELNSLPKDASVLDKVKTVFTGFGKGIFHFAIHVASFFYDWHYDEIEEGRRLVAEISDYHKYYNFVHDRDGRTAIDFQGGSSSWNGGGITFCLADQGKSNLCMDYFVSSDESYVHKCWDIDAQGSQDITLGLGESHELEHQILQKKVLLFIPAGSVTVVSGYKAASYSRYGKYKGNQDSNNFFAVQEAADKHMVEVMLSYYYQLYGESGDNIFYLGPQRSYVEGSGGKDTYVTSRNGCKTIINNYDPSKVLDTLYLSVNYNNISVQKSRNDVTLTYKGSHTVMIQNWFSGEAYRHMNMMSADGVLFEISSTVITSVELLARGINKRFIKNGTTVNASEPLLRNVANIFGSLYDDILIGNAMNNLIDGGGGRDRLCGGEGEDLYLVKDKNQSLVIIENYSRDNKSDLIIIEANLHTFTARVEGDDVHLSALIDSTAVYVTLVKWFRSYADRHLLIVTKDLITFTVSGTPSDCLQENLFTKCIRSSSIDYSTSSTPLVKDLQSDDTLDGVTEVRGSQFDDVIKANKEGNVLIPGRGNDFMEGREGEDWYIITPGQGVKTINNQSPDRASDVVFLQESYENLKCLCEGQNIVFQVLGQRTVIVQNWFESRENQHLQIKTSDGITAELQTNISSCDPSLMLPLTVDYRNQRPVPLQSSLEDLQKGSADVEEPSKCYRYRNKGSDRLLCGLKGKVMKMDEVKEMFGSSGFDVMVGNKHGNLIDPYTGGGLMFGGEGQDTYIIKQGYGKNLLIDNFAEDDGTDTVLVNMDFLDGSQVNLNSSAIDLNVTIITKEEELKLSLLGYNNGSRHQHLEFQSADGVWFQLKVLNSTGDVPVFQTEAFKVTLKQLQVDCRLDLSSLRNLSKVHTVQGCTSQSNNVLGNIQDNTLIGGWKDDILEGGEGDDTLIGGIGADILVGGTGDDTLYGEDGNDTLIGDSGWDVFIPGPGADLVDGGSGRDTVLYRGDPQRREGVYVNLLSGQGQYADAEGDVLKDVETVIGTIYSDILVSGYESSLLKGSDGNDLLVSTGDDYLVGGEGNDIYLLAFNNGTTTIDNCAKDNATDVLHLNSLTVLSFDFQLLSDRAILTFIGSDQTKVKVDLRGWVRDKDECGHLMVVSRELEATVDGLLRECEHSDGHHSTGCFNVITISVLFCFSFVL